VSRALCTFVRRCLRAPARAGLTSGVPRTHGLFLTLSCLRAAACAGLTSVAPRARGSLLPLRCLRNTSSEVPSPASEVPGSATPIARARCLGLQCACIVVALVASACGNPARARCQKIDTSVEPGAKPRVNDLAEGNPLLRGIVMPSPDSVEQDEPGGDAPDEHAAALARLVTLPFGWASDKDDQVRIMLPDSGMWKRVRYRGFEHLTGFRYGGNHHAISVVIVHDTRQGRAPTSESCMRYAETLARPRAHTLSVQTQPIVETTFQWRGKPLLVHSTDGEFPFGFRRIGFAAAWVAFPAYESACLYQAFGVKYEGHPELARQLRDRWVAEAATQVDIRTTTKPYRHE